MGKISYKNVGYVRRCHSFEANFMIKGFRQSYYLQLKVLWVGPTLMGKISYKNIGYVMLFSKEVRFLNANFMRKAFCPTLPPHSRLSQ